VICRCTSCSPSLSSSSSDPTTATAPAVCRCCLSQINFMMHDKHKGHLRRRINAHSCLGLLLLFVVAVGDRNDVKLRLLLQLIMVHPRGSGSSFLIIVIQVHHRGDQRTTLPHKAREIKERRERIKGTYRPYFIPPPSAAPPLTQSTTHVPANCSSGQLLLRPTAPSSNCAFVQLRLRPNARPEDNCSS
jgi:hypothetical protein